MKQLFASICVFSVLTGLSSVHLADASDLVAERKSNFKGNAAVMRGMKTHIGSADFFAIEAGALSVADWAEQMTDYFPAGSISDGAKPAIWEEFERFTLLASENHKAAIALAEAAQSEDMDAVVSAVQSLGASCQTCHNSYKN